MHIGTDIVQISRFKETKEHFVARVLTKEEQVTYNQLSDFNQLEFLATRWAAKEAIFKATQDPHYLKYAVLNDDTGKPYILNHPEILISLANDGDYALAMIVVE